MTKKEGLLRPGPAPHALRPVRRSLPLPRSSSETPVELPARSSGPSGSIRAYPYPPRLLRKQHFGRVRRQRVPTPSQVSVGPHSRCGRDTTDHTLLREDSPSSPPTRSSHRAPDRCRTYIASKRGYLRL